MTVESPRWILALALVVVGTVLIGSGELAAEILGGAVCVAGGLLVASEWGGLRG